MSQLFFFVSPTCHLHPLRKAPASGCHFQSPTPRTQAARRFQVHQNKTFGDRLLVFFVKEQGLCWDDEIVLQTWFGEIESTCGQFLGSYLK